MRQPAYDGWPRERLLEEVIKLKKRKKYGIVWEHKPEDVVEQCKRELPVLKEVKSKEIITDPTAPVNLLIEGDNYHALSVLNYTHKGKISVIYIDPPYNTGARDWKYNNDYVDINDAYRHSKWLSMMSSRLALAKNLLTKNGILITAIDDNEFATLKLLLEEFLPAHTHEVVVVNHHPQGSGGANISATHEYGIVSVPKGKHLFFGDFVGRRIEEWSLIKAGAGKDYYRIGRPNMFFAVHVNKKTGAAVGVGPELRLQEKYPTGETKEGFKIVYPLDKRGGERRWRYGRSTMLRLIKENRIKASIPSFSMKVIMPRDGSYKPLYSNWVDSKYNAGPHGTALLKNILPKTNFPYPKSLYTVMDFIAGATRLQKDSTILDFFAGSGTTGHAVLQLNKEDGGNRCFILCTNNENNIAKDVCYPRVSKIIKGYKNADGEKVSGLSGNLRYLKTSFVGAEPTDGNKEALTAQATEMLCVREGTFDLVKTTKAYKVFRGATRHTGIIFDPLALPQFRKELDRIKGNWSVYVFSLGDDTFDEEFADFGQRVKVSPVPEAILRIYRRIFSSDNNYGA